MCVQNRALFRVQPTWLFILKFLDMMLWYEMDWRWTEEWKNWKKRKKLISSYLSLLSYSSIFLSKTKLLPLLFCVNFKSSYIIIYILFNFSAIDVCHKLKNIFPIISIQKTLMWCLIFERWIIACQKHGFLSVLSKTIFLCLTRCC